MYIKCKNKKAKKMKRTRSCGDYLAKETHKISITGQFLARDGNFFKIQIESEFYGI